MRGSVAAVIGIALVLGGFAGGASATRSRIGGSQRVRIATYTVPSFFVFAAGFDAHRYWIVFVNQQYTAHYTLTVNTDVALPSGLRIAAATVAHPDAEKVVAAVGGASVSGADLRFVSHDLARDVLGSLVAISRRDFIAFAESHTNIPMLATEVLQPREALPLTSGFTGGNMTATWVLRVGTIFGSSSPLPAGVPLWSHECAVEPKSPGRVLVIVKVPADVSRVHVQIDGVDVRIAESVRDVRLRFALVSFSVPRGRHVVRVHRGSAVIDEFQLATCVD